MSTATDWIILFEELEIQPEDAKIYADNFVSERVRKSLLHRLNDSKLIALGVKRLGDREAILEYIEKRNQKTNSPVKISPSIVQGGSQHGSPPKKMRKFDEFLDGVKDTENIGEIIGKATKCICELENECNELQKYQLMLGIRSRIETLEAALIPPNTTIKSNISRFNRWLEIMNRSEGADEVIDQMKSDMKKVNLSEEWFCKSVALIYGDFNDKAAHNVALPDDISDQNIDEVAKCVGLKKDEPVIKTLRILISDLKFKLEDPDKDDDVLFEESAEFSL